ncbi:MAG: GapR family DNA-binding domain-containing protein [Pseudomonadota bacterium]
MDTKTSFAQGQLRSLIERIERLEEEKKAIAADIKEIYGEAKSNGFDTKIMRASLGLSVGTTTIQVQEQRQL